MARQRRCYADAGAMLDIRRLAWFDHPRCRESATYVHDPGDCEPPAGRRRNRSVPGCVVRSHAVRSSPADRIREEGKKFCCVTTRRRKFRFRNILGRGLGPLTAHFLCLGVLGFGGVGLTTFSLSPCRQPAVDLSQAFRILTVALVPTTRVVLATALFVDASSLAWAALSGFGTGFFFNVVVAHGRFGSQGKARGECVNILPERHLIPEQNDWSQSKAFSGNKTENKTALVRCREQDECYQDQDALREQDREQDGINSAPLTRRSDREPPWWLSIRSSC